ncbi:hypothetical protein IKQ19_18650 [Candidatus Saccharibacteria bacterium]|nr:hypothetical protein [Candidatus Saccharibacteria bacterium]
MKKFIQLSIGLFFIFVFLQSCDKTVAKIVLNEDLEYVVDVYGDEEDFFEPVAGVYPVTEKDGKLQVTIEFEKTKNTSSKKYIAEEFILNPSDKDDHYIKVNGKEIEFQAENRTSAAQDLLKAKVGDKVKVTFSYLPVDKQSKQELVGKIYSCDFDLSLEEEEENIENTSSLSSFSNDDDSEDDGDDEDDEEIASSKNSTNWDKVLDEYESYVNQYIVLMKKAKNGDMSAMNEYAKMLEKAQNFADKLEDADDAMTTAQMARYTKITAKMTQAAY